MSYCVDFENYMEAIESELNVRLLPHQKEILQMVYEGKPVYYMPARCRDKHILSLSLALLLSLKSKEDEQC